MKQSWGGSGTRFGMPHPAGAAHEPQQQPTSPWRTALVWVSGSTVLLALALLCLSAALVPLTPQLSDLDGGIPDLLLRLTEASTLTDPQSPTAGAALLIAGVAGALATLRLWWILTTTCAAAARGRVARRDGRARRLVLVACGVALSAGAVAPAHAADHRSLDGLPLPERTSATATSPQEPRPAPAGVTASTTPSTAPTTPEPTPSPRPTPSTAPAAAVTPAPSTRTSTHTTSTPSATTSADEAARTHVVVAGDTLWGIAGSTPGDEDAQTAARTAALVAALHEDNRAVVGDDPDLLLPGQVLTLPAQATTADPRTPTTQPPTTQPPTAEIQPAQTQPTEETR